ncbi:MAG: pilin [Candidatus Moranbacteria bacterium]|jgi:hypothetical protein|nr:pilin [Candidatus Moranbacteria bacterium]MDX9855843.1 pilin [Candidatus Moranbacteria bacterium]
MIKNINSIIIVFILAVFCSAFCLSVSAQVTCPDEQNWDNSTGVCIPTQTGLPSPEGDDPLAIVIINFMMWLLGILGFIAIIGFVIAGIMYMTSAGDDDRIKTAKNAMKWSIVGVIVALMGFVILQAVDALLSGDAPFLI